MAHFKFIMLAILTHFKLSLASRSVFLLTIIITILKQGLFLVGWNFFFVKYRAIQGWTFNDLLLMYGVVCFAVGFVETFFYGLKDLPKFVENGQLDTFLLQPKNVVLNIAMSKGDMAAFGEIITGLILIFYSGYMGKTLPWLGLILILTILFMFSLFLYLSCIAFFMRNSDDFIKELFLNAMIIATQPSVAYVGIFKIFTFSILPMALISFFPIEFLRTGLYEYLIITVLGTFVFFAVANVLFLKGLKNYESGNKFVFRN